MLEQISADYEGAVTFLAIGGRSDPDELRERAGQWMPSGRVLWADDADGDVWGLFGIRGTPTIVLLDADNRVANAWAGEVGEQGMRAALEELAAGA